MKTENEILKTVKKLLTELTGLQLDYERPAAPNREAQDDFKVIISSEDKQTFSYSAEVKAQINNVILSNIILRASKAPEKTLVVSNYIAPVHANKLRELKISYLDAAGNAFLKQPGLFILIAGRKSQITKKEKPSGMLRPAGVKLLLALLTESKLENTDYRTLAADTGIARSTIGELMSDLEKSGYLIKRSDQRILVRKPELIRRWTEAYAERFRVKLKPVRFRSTKFSNRWWEEVDLSEYKSFWGGETGGAKLTNHLKPQTATIYSDSLLPRLQLKYGLVRDERGEIEILKKFWTHGEIGNVAPPLVVYADLMAIGDERNIETAEMLYDRYLARTAEQNS